MSSEARPYFFGFLFFIVFGLVELINQDVFIFPFFLVAPVALGIMVYSLLKARRKPPVYNLVLLLSLIGVTLVSDFIPMVSNNIPGYLMDPTVVKIILYVIGICWLLSHVLYGIVIVKNDSKTKGYVFLFVASLLLWVLFDFLGDYLMQGLTVLCNLIILVIINRIFPLAIRDGQMKIFYFTLLFYNGLELLNGFAIYFI